MDSTALQGEEEIERLLESGMIKNLFFYGIFVNEYSYLIKYFLCSFVSSSLLYKE